jgi:hypothetical protein
MISITGRAVGEGAFGREVAERVAANGSVADGDVAAAEPAGAWRPICHTVPSPINSTSNANP